MYRSQIFMACVFGEMSTLKTHENWLSVVVVSRFGENAVKRLNSMDNLH